MMYLSSGFDMSSLPVCEEGGCRVTVRELEKGNEGGRGGYDGWRGPKLTPLYTLPPFCPPTPPRSRLSGAGDRRRVGSRVCVCLRRGGGCLACGGQRSGTWSRPPHTHTHTHACCLPFPPVPCHIQRQPANLQLLQLKKSAYSFSKSPLI